LEAQGQEGERIILYTGSCVGAVRACFYHLVVEEPVDWASIDEGGVAVGAGARALVEGVGVPAKVRGSLL
jgi:hypothetical protein